MIFENRINEKEMHNENRLSPIFLKLLNGKRRCIYNLD